MQLLAAGNGTFLDGFRDLFDGLSTAEARLAVTAGLLLAVLVVVIFVAPTVISKLSDLVENALPDGRATTVSDVINAYLPTSVARLFLRVVQLTTVLLTAIALLAVWGLVSVAVDVLTFFERSLPVLTKLGATVVLLFLAYVGADLLEDSVARYSKGADRITEHQEEIIYRVGNLGILAVVVATALTVWGINLSGLLVGAGFLGIVVGLAARQTLGSLIAGFVLMFSRPFTIGDWVAIGNNEGIVTNITIVNTRLENFDGESIVIPNDTVSNTPIINRSERGRLRIRVDVGVDYDSDPEHAQDVAIDAIDEVQAVAPTPPPQAIPKSFGDSAVVLELRFWIDRPTPQQKWRATGAVVRAVKDAFEEEGIKIPFPQRELTGRAETGGFRVHDSATPTVDAPPPEAEGED